MARDDPFAGTPYRGMHKIGSGAQGSVWMVEHRRLGTQLAAKLVNERHAGSAALTDRLRAEAQALAALDHENLVKVRDLAFLPDGRMYFVMDRLAGRTLKEVLVEDGALVPNDACEVARQALSGLEEAHRAGIVHRDIKPANLFCCDAPSGRWRVKVLDFGVAKLLEEAKIMPLMVPTATGTAAGTPRYMAPEQVLGRAIDGRVDLYAMGIVLYECLTGSSPFHRHKGLDVLVAHVQERPEPPSARARQIISPALDELVLRALEKDPDRRFASAADFLAALDALDGAPIVAATVPAEPRSAAPAPVVAPEPVLAPAPVVAPTTRFEDDPALRRFVVTDEAAMPSAPGEGATAEIPEEPAEPAAATATDLMVTPPVAVQPAPRRAKPPSRRAPLLALAAIFVIMAFAIALAAALRSP